MRPEIFWIYDHPTHGRIGTMARPRAGDWLEDEILGWRSVGVSVVISALMAGEELELGLMDEGELCGLNGLDFQPFPIPDRGVPDSIKSFWQMIEDRANDVRNGRTVVAHCRIGLGRASLIGAGMLVSLGMPLHEAWRSISIARGFQVPDTEEQKLWLEIGAGLHGPSL